MVLWAQMVVATVVLSSSSPGAATTAPHEASRGIYGGRAYAQVGPSSLTVLGGSGPQYGFLPSLTLGAGYEFLVTEAFSFGVWGDLGLANWKRFGNALGTAADLIGAVPNVWASNGFMGGPLFALGVGAMGVLLAVLSPLALTQSIRGGISADYEWTIGGGHPFVKLGLGGALYLLPGSAPDEEETAEAVRAIQPKLSVGHRWNSIYVAADAAWSPLGAQRSAWSGSLVLGYSAPSSVRR